jgi:mono/diheme cytochrome c family protein
MRTRLSIFTILVLSIGLFISGCGKSPEIPAMQPGSDNLARPAPPADYAEKKSPIMSATDIDEGKRLYETNCTSCHGETGLGDGPAAPALDPKPQALARTSSVESDAYLFWRISSGGGVEPFKSAMPAWKTVFNEKQIWQLIAYLRKISS